MVKANIKVVNNLYEIPVAVKIDMVDILANDSIYALALTASLRRQVLKNSKIKRALIETFVKLISAGWLAPADSTLIKNSC